MDVKRFMAGWLIAGTIVGGLLMAPASGVDAASSPRSSAGAALVGVWLGPALADGGNCGRSYGQFTFFRNAEYSYTTNSELCGGYTNAGSYRLQSGVLTLHWTVCNFPCAAGTAATRFAFVNRAHTAFELVDQGRAYVYYRQ